MFRELITMWTRQGLMTKVVDEFAQMLEDDSFVFSNAWQAIQGKAAIEQISGPVRERDKSVNKRERVIRRMLVEHLTVNPSQDVSGCLIMMSLVKDAERIGDYSKNIFDLGVMLKGKSEKMKYIGQLSAIQCKLWEQLGQLQRAFPAGDEGLAKQILGEYASIKTNCSKILEDLLADSLQTREAVTTALLSRFLKRINSHISNIASGLVYPIDQIDFVRGGISD
jgi:phosphate transport system protein